MEKISSTFEKAELKNLLEVIEHNLGVNIGSIYNEAMKLIPEYLIKGREQLAWKKEELKKQIRLYLKIVVKNIIYYLNHNFEWSIKSRACKYLNEAIKE